MNFLDFLISLAPEGETALIVRQKPIGKELQFHADGAIKCTWPAMLPNARIKDDWAIYGNTASFIIDRFKDGHVSASAVNCEYVLVMVLDDVGTKAAIPPLEPTWKIETSEGSFQWGYAFSDQPTKADFSAAIKAIADAGYTDKGAINAVRNFRLPGSINLKPDRNNFAAKLVEFHPSRDFTLDQICDALGVVPAPADSIGFKPIRLSDDGADDVMAWLSGQGLLLSKPNQEGWAGVICPNSAEHTDGNPEGRYMPANRAYCCLHSHCVEFGSSLFLQWVADNDGPAHTPGLREELLAQAMDLALSKITPTADYPDEAARVIADPLQEHRRVKLKAVRVQAAVRTIGGHVAALGVAVGVLGAVRADHASPAFLVRAGQQQTVIRKPHHHVVCAVVRNADRAEDVARVGGWRDLKGGAYLGQSKVALWMELDQHRRKPLTPRFKVDRAGQTEVAYRVDRAGVGVASVSNGFDGGGVLALGGLFVEHITPLERTRRRLDLPRRLERGQFGFCAHVI